MPYIDLVSSDDYASIWYFAHTPNGNVGSFDPEKPTIIMLHPLFLDSTWLHPQFDDQRLYSSYNLVVFDTRSAGKSLSRYNGRYDLWVGAADLALAIQVCSDFVSWKMFMETRLTEFSYYYVASTSAAGSHLCFRAIRIYRSAISSIVSTIVIA